MRLRNRFLLVVLFALLLAPRCWSLLSPTIWVEDDSYLGNAFMMFRGLHPYESFVSPHFPVLEGSLSIVFRMFGASVASAEVFTAVIQFVSTLLVFLIGTKLAGPSCGITSSILFAFHPLLVRYQVFEREVFVIFPVLLGAWVAMRTLEKDVRYSGFLIGALLALAILFKISAMVYVAGFAAFLGIVGRKRDAVKLVMFSMALFLCAILIFYFRYGRSFLLQVFVFQFIGHSSSTTLLGKLALMRGRLNPVFDIGLLGLLVSLKTWRKTMWPLPATQILFFVVANLLLKGTLWIHNLVEILPWFCIFAGLSFSYAIGATRSLSTKRGRDVFRLAGAVGVIAGALIWYAFSPRPREVDRHLSRDTLRALSTFVGNESGETEQVFVPSIVAFEANRFEPVPYMEVAGSILELERQAAREGLIRTFQSSPERTRTLVENVDNAHLLMAPHIVSLIQARRIRVVINRNTEPRFMLLNLSDSLLLSSGYQLAFEKEGYRTFVLPHEQPLKRDN